MKLDLAIRLWQQGYDALPRIRKEAHGADVVDIRVAGRRAVAVRGREHVARFYDESQVQRDRAVPSPLSGLLFGKGAVHGLDGEEHLHRKELFLGLLDQAAVSEVTKSAESTLNALLDENNGHTLPLFDLLAEAYGAAVIGWSGIRLDADELRQRSRQLAQIVDGFGFQGVALPRAVLARRSLNRWAARLVDEARAEGHPGTPIQAIADHRDLAGRLLDRQVAGVELLNILRPTVAVAYLGVFAALALGEHPDLRERLQHDDATAHAFAQEVRRMSPFVPALAGRATRDQDWDGCPVRQGQRILLDVPAVNHDERTWTNPESFDPERFTGRSVGEYDLVPQGGGPLTGHRCPGEALTISLLVMTARCLVGRSDWTVSDGPTAPSYDRSRIPARPYLHLVRLAESGRPT